MVTAVGIGHLYKMYQESFWEVFSHLRATMKLMLPKP